MAATALVACAAKPSGDDADSSESNETSARPALAAPTWTRCWIEKDTSTTDTFFQQHEVGCRYDVPASPQPIKPKGMIVEVHDAKGGAGTMTLDDKAGQDVLVRRVTNDDFPLKLYVTTYSDDLETIGLENAGVLSAQLDVANVDAASKDHPIAVKQPFDLWPVTILQKTNFYSLQIDRFAISIAPFRFGQSVDAVSDGFASGLAMGQDLGAAKTFYFIAPKQDGLSAKYQAGSEAAARIDAPGVYVAEDGAFRKATDEESGGAPPPSASDAGPADAAPAPAPPAPTCGVAGKTCCGGSSGGYGGTCDDGSFCMAGGNTCVACGEANATCCNGPSNNGYGGTCKAGAFCLAGGNTCVSCGNANETCCNGPSNNGYGGDCNTGSFCMAGGNTCISCGKPGQACCGGPSNNGYGGTCDPGATCEAGGNVCVAN